MKTYEQQCALLLETIKHSYELGHVRDLYISQLEKGITTAPALQYALFIFDQIEGEYPSNKVNRADIHLEFEEWMKDAIEETSPTRSPYDDPIHEICWMIWYGLALENGPSNL